MNAALIFVVGLGVLAPALKDAPSKEPGLVGEWWVQTFAYGDTTAHDVSYLYLNYVFCSDRTWSEGGLIRSGRTYTVNLKADVATIDMLSGAGTGGGLFGVYRLSGDTLTICVALGRDDRPTSLESRRGSKAMLMVLKRVTKKN